MTTTEQLRAFAILVSSKIAPHCAVCEFSAEDDTPTIHINLWRKFDLFDLPAEIQGLKIVAEGHWDGGRSYSLQIL